MTFPLIAPPRSCTVYFLPFIFNTVPNGIDASAAIVTPISGCAPLAVSDVISRP
ncbi:hypothetical protein MKC90_02410 [[Clostridium] innocuum]|nr:hypothetical protein [[Clostridium] innocuum]